MLKIVTILSKSLANKALRGENLDPTPQISHASHKYPFLHSLHLPFFKHLFFLKYLGLSHWRALRRTPWVERRLTIPRGPRSSRSTRRPENSSTRRNTPSTRTTTGGQPQKPWRWPQGLTTLSFFLLAFYQPLAAWSTLGSNGGSGDI